MKLANDFLSPAEKVLILMDYQSFIGADELDLSYVSMRYVSLKNDELTIQVYRLGDYGSFDKAEITLTLSTSTGKMIEDCSMGFKKCTN